MSSPKSTANELEPAIDGSSLSFQDLRKFFHSASGSDITKNITEPGLGHVGCSPPKPRPPLPPIPPKPAVRVAVKPQAVGSLNGVREDKAVVNDSNSVDNFHDDLNHPTAETPNGNANSLEETNGNSADENHVDHLETMEPREYDKDDEESAGMYGEDDENYDGWGSEEFSSDSDSDHNEDQCQNKRQSMVIFNELDGIPEVVILDTRKRKIYNIVKEILTTEITYVKNLKLLDDMFFFRLDNECRAKNIIPKEALLEIFSNIKAIHQFHRDFLLPKLEERMTNWDKTPRVGDIFKSLAPFLKLYVEYVKNFDQAMNSLRKWKLKSQKLAAIIEEIQKTEECNYLTLEHHMLGPVQRVPRYKLLLKDYISKLPEDSDDLEESNKALEIITSAANHANESMKKTERFQKMLEMQEKFPEGISIITPSREFIMEGELVKISARNGQPLPRILILFNDTIFCCTKVAATGKYKVRQEAELKDSQVEETEEEIGNRELVFRVLGNRKVIDFQASSAEEKEKWVEALNTAIKNAKDKKGTFGAIELPVLAEDQLGKIAPVWVKDSAVSMCMECTMAFTTLKRRHHCRACGKIVCSNCSGYKAPLEYDHDKPNRICSSCFKIITKGQAAKGTKKASKEARPKKRVVYADSVINGYLNYRGETSKAWSKRWCSLGNDFTLHVFRAKKDIKAQTTIPLPGFEVKDHSTLDEADKLSGKHVFKVSHKGYGSFLFDADGDENFESWLLSIGYAIKAEAPPSPSPSPNSSVSSPPSTPTPMSP